MNSPEHSAIENERAVEPESLPVDSVGAPVEIKVENLHRAFRQNQVLCGVDLEIHRGDMVAIVGGSGCGKTVLLEHIIAHHTPDQGRVSVVNHGAEGSPLVDLAELDNDGLDEIRMHWAVVFQRNALFSGTVYDNIALWLREIRRLKEREIMPRAQEALQAVGFDDPSQILRQDRDELSGGMAKRVAIARGLAMDPVLMFYDEPTTGLDPHHAAQIQYLIGKTHARPHEGRPAPTTVIITHDKDLLHRLRPRVVMLHEGRVFFDDTYEEFARSESEIIQPYFELMPVLQRRVSLS